MVVTGGKWSSRKGNGRHETNHGYARFVNVGKRLQILRPKKIIMDLHTTCLVNCW